MAASGDWQWSAGDDWNACTIYNQQCSWAPRRDLHADRDDELLSHTKREETDYSETLAHFEALIREMRRRRPQCLGCGREYTSEDNLAGFGCRVHLCARDIGKDGEEVYGCTGLPTVVPHMSPPCTPCVHTGTQEAFDTYVLLGHDNFIAIPASLARVPPERGGLNINENHIAAETEHNVYLFCNRDRMKQHKPYDPAFLERIRELDLVYLGESLSVAEERRIRDMPLEHLVTVKRGETARASAMPVGTGDGAFGHLWETPLAVPSTEQLLQFFSR